MGERTVLLLTGEPSGDRLGARLAEELRAREPGVRILAVGGPALRAAGAEIVQDIAELSAMGFVEVLRQVPRLRRLEARLLDLLRDVRPDVVVPIDYPGFNLRVARGARERGFRVVYYVGPQVWAWGAGRVPKIGRAVDHMLVVFPFEEELYRSAGIPVTFVGHPLLDTLEHAPQRGEARAALGLGADRPVLGLLAGSRAQEVRRVLPVMLRSAERVRKERPALDIVASVAPGVPASEYDAALRAARIRDVRLETAPAATIARAADVLLVTSGTATLEAALHGTPLAVLYRASPVTWWIGRRVVRIPRISLVNIVAEEELVPEFLQNDARPEPIAAWVTGLLDDPAARADLSGRLAALAGSLGEPGASARAASAVLDEANAR